MNAPVFAPGARVVVRGEEWLVRTTRRALTGASAVHVTGISELVRGRDAIFLSDLDHIEELRPEDTELVVDPSPRFRRSILWLETLLRRSPPTEPALSFGHLGAVDSAAFQLVPAFKALSQLRPRILIADGVGLGKTIEVGILLSELIRRGQGERILVVALKSILTQFQQELWARFAIPLVRLDSEGLARVRSRVPANKNPFYVFDRAIVSIDTLKKDEKYRRWLEACHWDVVVIDECQNVALKGRGTQRSQRARLAELLSRTSNALIMTSATPHDGTPESFASLVQLLEPTAIADPSKYGRDDVEPYFVRRFKKDVRADLGEAMLHERDVAIEHVEPSEEEEAVFVKLARTSFRTVDDGKAGALFRTTLLKALLSSVAAFVESVEQRLRHPRLAKDDDAAAADRAALLELRELAGAVRVERFAKLHALVELLRKAGIGKKGSKERVVVFSERIATLKLLEEELKKRLGLDDEEIAMFHGALDDIEQQARVRDFGAEASRVRVLLCSDAASEGINLHFFCRTLVHFDLPWSLITLEQRNGRIDRYGQERQPLIRYLATRPRDRDLRGDLRILDLLVEREKAANENLGDVRWLMRLHDPEKEEERIAAAIADREDPAFVLPEVPTSEEAVDFLALLGAADDQAAEEKVAEVPLQTPRSLFSGDLEYAREAFAELHAQGEEVTAEISGDTITLPVPADLRHRLAHLPREMRGDGELSLTVDRAAMQRAYKKARSARGAEDKIGWPKVQLFWGVHPVAEWLEQRVLGLFRRHETPVMAILPKDAAPCFVFQGVLSNERSAPVLVEWFGVRMPAGGPPEIVPFDALEPSLKATHRNPGGRAVPAHLKELVAPAVEAAREHMRARRKERSKALMPRLKEELRRLEAWKQSRLGAIEDAKARITEARALRRDDEKRLEARRREVVAHYEARYTWIDRTLRTAETPFVRVAALLVAEDER